MGSWSANSSVRGWSYHGINSGGSIDKTGFAKYTNSSSYTEYISNIKIKMATVNGSCTFGDDVTGYGGAISVYAYTGNYVSSSVSVTATTGVTSYTEGNTTGTIPVSGNAVEYTLTFSTPVPVSANSSVTFNCCASSSGQTVLYASRSPSGTVNSTPPVTNYTLTIDPNGGTYSDTNPVIGQSGDTITLSDPVRAGYTFTGWTKTSGQGSLTQGFKFVFGNGDATVRANWTQNVYTLTINPNGGTYIGNTTITGTSGSKTTISTPTRSGHTFGGWSKSGSGTLSGSTFTFGNGDTTLTAVWDEIPVYTLTLKPNGGTWSDGSVNNKYYEGEEGDSISIPTISYMGYTFGGWSRSGSGSVSGSTFTFGAGDTTLTASWDTSNYYTITINPNGGSMYPGGPNYKDKVYPDTVTSESSSFTKKFAYGTPRHLTDFYYAPNLGHNEDQCWVMPNSPKSICSSAAKYGYTNTGWTVTGGSISEYPVGSSSNAFVLAYNANSETDFIARSFANVGGWIFNGNYAGSVTATAQWTPNKYNFSFNINLPSGETANITTPTTLTNQNYNSQLTLPVLSNLDSWDFIGWNVYPTSTSSVGTTNVEDYVHAYAIKAILSGEDNPGYLSGITIPLYAVWARKGSININVDGEWKIAQVYIYVNDTDKWKQTIPYIYTDSWHQVAGK